MVDSLKKCHICHFDFDESDDTNNDGWWCGGCDSFNYWNDERHENHKFTIILEDKSNQEGFSKINTNFKKHLSPLRYPGGKSKMINFLSTFLRNGKCDTLISPFAGGGSFELALLEAGVIKKLVLNDLDYGIYSLWWTILHMPDALIAKIETFKPSQKAYFDAQALIKTDYRHLNNIEAAWITLLVNRLAFSGIAKANPLGGRHGDIESLTARWNPQTLIKKIKAIYEMGAAIEIHCEDAVQFIEEWYWNDNATIFVDPPYYLKGEKLYTLFYTEKDHINLSHALQDIHTGFPSADVIVTYDFHEFIDKLYVHADDRIVVGRKYSI